MYAGLLRKAVQDTNAIAILRSKSLGARLSTYGDPSLKQKWPTTILEIDLQMIIWFSAMRSIRYCGRLFAAGRNATKPVVDLEKKTNTLLNRFSFEKIYTRRNSESGGETARGPTNQNTVPLRRSLKPPTLACSSPASRAMKLTQLLDKT